MYRSNATSCPSCHSELQPLPTTLSLSGCFACGGMWLGPEAAVHVMRGLGDAVEQDVAAASAETARRSFHPPAPDSGSRECPTCGLVMLHFRVEDIVLDSCPTHGSFFDRDEVKGVVAAVRRLRRRQSPGLENRALEIVDRLSAGASKMFGATFEAFAEEVDAISVVPKDE